MVEITRTKGQQYFLSFSEKFPVARCGQSLFIPAFPPVAGLPENLQPTGNDPRGPRPWL